MSQTFPNTPVDWSDYFHSPPPPPTSTPSNQPHFQSPTPDSTTFAFNSSPPNTNSTTTTTTTTTRVNRKPIRKRSRASRRTPTTLLSTDTTNFRAMVQQFTGGPSALGLTGIDHPVARRASDQRQVVAAASLPFVYSGNYGFQFQQQPARHGCFD